MTQNATVFVVDPDASIRDELAVLLRRSGWSAETYASAAEFLGRPRRLAPGCLLLDVSLPGLAGLELLQHVATDRTETPVIVISGGIDVPTTVRTMRSGAIELLTKPIHEDTLAAAVGHAIERSEATLPQATERQSLRRRHATLSAREREVMVRVVAGLLNKRIAAALGISEITVKAHRGQVMRKMAAESLADLVRMAMTLRLTTEPAMPMRASPARDTRMSRPTRDTRMQWTTPA
jgi:FixJ family two-component response regulator